MQSAETGSSSGEVESPLGMNPPKFDPQSVDIGRTCGAQCTVLEKCRQGYLYSFNFGGAAALTKSISQTYSFALWSLSEGQFDAAS